MRTLRYILIFLIFFACSAAAQPQLLQNIQGRKVTSLNGNWNYIIDPYENGYYSYRREAWETTGNGKGGYYEDKTPSDKKEADIDPIHSADLVEYDFDHSPTLVVPGDWNSQAEKLALYEGTIWYRRKFNVDVKAGKRYILYFGAVNYEAHVYLNGKKVGIHKGAFDAFQFEVTGQLKPGENTVIVKADNTRKKDEIPTIQTDWWNYGGLTRDVYVAELPETYIADYKVQLAKGDAKYLDGYVQLDGKDKNRSISLDIPEAGLKMKLKADASGRAAIHIPVKKLDYWSPDNPKLYQVTLNSGTDAVTDRIGFRTIEVKGKDIFLNGKSTFLRGISIHDENPLVAGRNRGTADLRMLLTWAKELNCNFVRLAHYQHNEQMTRLADEMGIMVWAEIPVYWTISWENPETDQNAEHQLNGLIGRDVNRASIIIWSIGNETPVSAPRNKFMGSLADKARSLDDTRLIGAALEVNREGDNVVVDDPLGEKLDLASFNEYAGWYWGGDPADIAKFNFTVKYNKPVVITEFGGDALGGYHATASTRWSEEYQEALYKNQIAMLSKIGALRGVTPWILADFKSPRRPHPVYQNFWNRKGLISQQGQKKLAFYVLRNFYNSIQQQYK